jgi:hypothetical protein
MGDRAADLARADERNAITRHKNPLCSTPKPAPQGLVHAKGWLNAILSARKVLVAVEARDRGRA